MKKINKKFFPLLGVVVLCLQLAYGLFIGQVQAATLEDSYIRLDRMSDATATSLRLVFTVPAGNSATEASVVIGLPGFTINESGETASVATCNAQTGATVLPGTLTVTGDNTGKTITIGGVTNLSASTAYCVDIDDTDAVTTPAVGQYTATVTTRTSAPADIDTTSIALRVIDNDSVVVSATVPATFNFVLDGNTTSFGNPLNAADVELTTTRTVTVNTNAPNGWFMWAKDSNTGLDSTAASPATVASTTPGTTATLTPGTAGYVVGFQATTNGAGGGTPSVTAAYSGTIANDTGSGLDTTYRQVASSAGTANGDVISFWGKATINGDEPAANDYTDTWTLIGAGSF